MKHVLALTNEIGSEFFWRLQVGFLHFWWSKSSVEEIDKNRKAFFRPERIDLLDKVEQKFCWKINIFSKKLKQEVKINLAIKDRI